MKDFNIFGVSLKNLIFREEGVQEKPIYRGIARKGGAWTVCRFKEGGLARQMRGVFLRGGGGWGWGVDTPVHTMFYAIYQKFRKTYHS